MYPILEEKFLLIPENANLAPAEISCYPTHSILKMEGSKRCQNDHTNCVATFWSCVPLKLAHQYLAPDSFKAKKQPWRTLLYFLQNIKTSSTNVWITPKRISMFWQCMKTIWLNNSTLKKKRENLSIFWINLFLPGTSCHVLGYDLPFLLCVRLCIHLSVCPSVRPSVHPSVCPSILPTVTFWTHPPDGPY